MRYALLIAVALRAWAQEIPPTLTLSSAVHAASSRYASVQVSQAQLAAARAGINLARAAYLPRADFLGQVNRGTRNNVFGQLLPQSVIPSMSGPVLGTDDMTNVWGSAVGVLVSWEPFDFGLRRANVGVAGASARRAEATLARTQFETAALAADAYLTLLAAQQTVRAAQAGVDRSEVAETAISAVVKAELRPGADLSRSKAETALARTQLAQAKQAEAIARATLAQFIGANAADIRIDSGRLTDAPSGAVPEDQQKHPRIIEQAAAIEEVKAREDALDRLWYPRFNLQSAAYGRGTGAFVNGATGGAVTGLAPNYGNWAIGLSITFPLMDFASIRARKQVEAGNEHAETARLKLVSDELKGQLERARAQLEGARAVAANTPAQLDAARESEKQALARYRAGLSTAVELADAERLLTQTEIDDVLARLNIWRAMLSVAAASGDLEPMLRMAEK